MNIMEGIDEFKNKLGNSLNTISEGISEMQEKFLKSDFGKALNSALDLGIQVILPDIIEDEVIDIKDAIMEGGLKSGFEQAIESLKNLKDSAVGIVTGAFENISQIQTAVKNGGLIDTASNLLGKAIDKAEENGVITKSTQSKLKKGKNTILDKLSDNISKSLEDQIKYVEKVEEYNEKWLKCFEDKDFDGMERAYNNLKKYVEKCIPLEETLVTARKYENIHSVVKNNLKANNNVEEAFNLSESELELSAALT